MLEAQPAAGEAVPSGVFPAWAKTVRRLAQHHAATGASDADEVHHTGGDPAPPVAQGRRAGQRGGRAVRRLLAVGIVIGRGNDRHVSSSRRPDDRHPKLRSVAAPTTTTSRNFPGPGEALDGSYRVDVNRTEQTYNSTPDPQPPNVSTWWAFRTSCTPTPAWPPGPCWTTPTTQS